MSLRTGASILAITVGVANPVWAEMDARAVWGDVSGMLSFMGEVSFDQITESETEVNITGIAISIEDGRDLVEVTLPQVLISETDDGGVRATFAPGIQASNTGTRDDNFVSIDVISDGLTITFNDTSGLAFSIAADLLGAENMVLRLDGAPQDIGGSIVIDALDVAFSDTGNGAATQQMEYRANFEAVTGSGFVRNVEDVVEMSGELSIAGLQSSGEIDAPVDLFLGRTTGLTGTLISQAAIDLGAVAMTASFQGLKEEEEDTASLAMTMALDHLRFDHAATAPLDERLYANGQDVVADDLEAFVDYSLGELTLDLQSDFGYGYNSFASRDVVDLQLSETSASGRIEVDENSDLTLRSVYAATMAMDVMNTYRSEYSESDTSVVFDLANLDYALDVAVPLDNAMMQFMQGLPDELLYAVNYSADSGAFEFSEETSYGDEETFLEAASGRLDGLSASGRLTGTEFEMALQLAGMEGQYAGNDAPDGLNGSLSDMRLSADFPLATGTSVAPYSYEFGVGELVLGPQVWAMVDPAGELDQSPMSVELTASGETFANFSPMGFVAFGTAGFTPMQPQTLAFDMLVTAAGARLAGTGAFDVSEVITDETPPVGTANFEGNGIADLMTAMGRLGLLSEDELSEGQFLLGAFTTQDGDGTRRMAVEINEEQHLIVNGQRMQ